MARQVVSLQVFLGQLHPSYDDCPGPCALTIDDERPLDLPDYCAECDVRRQLDFFEEAARDELRRRFRPGECQWSFEGLSADVFEAMRRARGLRRGAYPRGCDALTARLLDVLRREQDRPRRVADWEWWQKRK